VQNLTLAGDYAAARAAHGKLTLLHNAMFYETNPVPVKYAVSLLGKCDASVRLPLVGATPEAQKSRVASDACGWPIISDMAKKEQSSPDTIKVVAINRKAQVSV